MTICSHQSARPRSQIDATKERSGKEEEKEREAFSSISLPFFSPPRLNKRLIGRLSPLPLLFLFHTSIQHLLLLLLSSPSSSIQRKVAACLCLFHEKRAGRGERSGEESGGSGRRTKASSFPAPSPFSSSHGRKSKGGAEKGQSKAEAKERRRRRRRHRSGRRPQPASRKGKRRRRRGRKGTFEWGENFFCSRSVIVINGTAPLPFRASQQPKIESHLGSRFGGTNSFRNQQHQSSW